MSCINRSRWFRAGLFLALMIATIMPVSSQQVVRVLFIGNSMTYWNNMLTFVMSLNKDLGSDPKILVTDNTIANAGLREQLSDTSFWSALGAIRKGGFDVVVLQGKASEPLEEPEEFSTAAIRFAEEAKAIGANPLFYQTYVLPPAFRIFYEQPWSGASPAEMQARVSAAYAAVAKQTNTRVARVGDAFLWLSLNHPEIKLFSDDFIHPSIGGSYLMACMFASLLSGKDPRMASWIPSTGVTDQEAILLRSVAWDFTRE